MKKIITLLLLILFLGNTKVVGQTSSIDSLKSALRVAKQDSIRCKVLSQLAEWASDDEWPAFNDQLLQLAEKNLVFSTDKNTKHLYTGYLGAALNNKGLCYDLKGDANKALEYYKKCLSVYSSINDKKGMAVAFNNIGLVFQNQGNVPEALKYFENALSIQEKLADKAGMAATLNSMGFVFKHQGDTEKALEFYKRSLNLREEISDKRGLATSLNNIGATYRAKGDLIAALGYYEKSIKIREEINDKKGIAGSLNNIALIHTKQGDADLALANFQQCLKLREEIGDKKGIAAVLNNIGMTYNTEKKHAEALRYAKQSMILSQELQYPENIKNAAELLFLIYKNSNNAGLALENYQLYIRMRDSISNEETKNAALKSQLKYEYEKKAVTDAVIAAEEKKVVLAQLKQERTLRYALYGGLVLMILFVFVMLNRYRVIRRQKKLIEKQKHLVDEKQKEILDSIHYAKRIQTALLTSEKYIHRKLGQRK